MSNLNLPAMTYTTLNAMLHNAWLKGKDRVTIAYETTIQWGHNNSVIVRHHNNQIAAITPDAFTLDNAGWDTRTTADRLNRILRDNQTALPSDPDATDRLYYHVCIREGLMVVAGWNYKTKQTILRHFSSSVAHFSRVDSDHHYVLQGGDEYIEYPATVYGRVIDTQPMRRSKNGNPRYKVTIEGYPYTLVTAVDSMLAYAITNRDYAEKPHTFYVNRKGEIGTRP